MRSLLWVLAVGLLSPVAVFVHASKVVTVRIPTGTCYPDGGIGVLAVAPAETVAALEASAVTGE